MSIEQGIYRGIGVATEETLLGVAGLVAEAYDYIIVTRNANLDIATAVFKTGGSSGTTVATLTLTYDVNNDFLSVTKT